MARFNNRITSKGKIIFSGVNRLKWLVTIGVFLFSMTSCVKGNIQCEDNNTPCDQQEIVSDDIYNI